MKRFVILLCLLSLISCSEEDDDNPIMYPPPVTVSFVCKGYPFDIHGSQQEPYIIDGVEIGTIYKAHNRGTDGSYEESFAFFVVNGHLEKLEATLPDVIDNGDWYSVEEYKSFAWYIGAAGDIPFFTCQLHEDDIVVSGTFSGVLRNGVDEVTVSEGEFHFEKQP